MLGLRTTADRAVIYREKWTALVFAFGICAFCIAFAAAFYLLAAERGGAVVNFAFVFSAVFGIAGIAGLVRLPQHASRLMRTDGAAHLEFDAQGIAITPALGADTQRWAWSDIAEVRLAERFKAVDRDETGYRWCCVLILPRPGRREADAFFDRLRSGVVRSGEGRDYVAGRYPRGAGMRVRDAIRRHAQPGILVESHARVVFDRRQGRDSYEEA